MDIKNLRQQIQKPEFTQIDSEFLSQYWNLVSGQGCMINIQMAQQKPTILLQGLQYGTDLVVTYLNLAKSYDRYNYQSYAVLIALIFMLSCSIFLFLQFDTKNEISELTKKDMEIETVTILKDLTIYNEAIDEIVKENLSRVKNPLENLKYEYITKNCRRDSQPNLDIMNKQNKNMYIANNSKTSQNKILLRIQNQNKFLLDSLNYLSLNYIQKINLNKNQQKESNVNQIDNNYEEQYSFLVVDDLIDLIRQSQKNHSIENNCEIKQSKTSNLENQFQSKSITLRRLINLLVQNFVERFSKICVNFNIDNNNLKIKFTCEGRGFTSEELKHQFEKNENFRFNNEIQKSELQSQHQNNLEILQKYLFKLNATIYQIISQNKNLINQQIFQYQSNSQQDEQKLEMIEINNSTKIVSDNYLNSNDNELINQDI